MISPIDRLLTMLECPSEYTEKEWQDVLRDDEARALYRQLTDVKQALTHAGDIDVPDAEAEWRRLTARRSLPLRRLRVTAAAAVVVLLAGVAVAALLPRIVRSPQSELAVPACSIPPAGQTAGAARTVRAVDTLRTDPVMFDNVPMEDIGQELARHYGVRVVFGNEEVKHVRLYWEWQPTQPLVEVVELLNHFEQVRLTLTDQTLTID